MADDRPFKTLREIGEGFDAGRRDVARRMANGTARWGNWHYVPDHGTGTLEHRYPAGGSVYEVDLATCDTGAEVLDWILQIDGKSWASAEDVGYLVRALSDILSIQGWAQDLRQSTMSSPSSENWGTRTTKTGHLIR